MMQAVMFQCQINGRVDVLLAATAIERHPDISMDGDIAPPTGNCLLLDEMRELQDHIRLEGHLFLLMPREILRRMNSPAFTCI